MAQYYFDMDGVLAVYDRAGYLPASAGETPAYLKPGYFCNRAIDERACYAFLRMLYENQYDTPEHTIRCLTTVSSTGSLFVQQYHDKNKWLYQMFQHMKKRYPEDFLIKQDKHFLESNKQIIVPAVTNKHQIVDTLNGKSLNLNQILIDDYNENLIEWKKAGGLAIKYLNSINSPDSWNGPCIDPDMSANDIIDFLKCLSYSL